MIAGGKAMRFATRNGKYPRPPHSAPSITGTLPKRAVAVMIHGADGCAATLCLDLDTSKASQSQVDADAAAICALLTSCGLRYIADHSPSGGRHIYVPLATRLAAADARELVEALGIRFTSLDPGPHRNITEGCIRPPGSLHKSGKGFQVLDTPLSQAYDVLRRRNPDSAVAALRKSLVSAIHQLRASKVTPLVRTVAAAGALPGKGSHKLTELQQAARTGNFNRAAYKSNSHARMSMLNSLVNSGLSLDEVHRDLHTKFPGLASTFKDQAQVDRLLAKEWTNAQNWVAQKPAKNRDGVSSTPNYDTEPDLPHGGGTPEARSTESVMQEINDLENVLYAALDQRLARSGREGISLRLLLRAVIGFARTKKSLLIDVGCRSFALEMGKHHGTIAKLLPRLEKVTEGLVERVDLARGRHADVYLLSVPDRWKETARRHQWRSGKIYGMRPVFWPLGDVPALVYEAIERQRKPSSTADIVRFTGITRNAVDRALTTMAELSMIERHHGYWRLVSTTNLKQLADWLGAQEHYELRKLKIKKQRLDWQARLQKYVEPPVYEEDIEDTEQAAYSRGELTLQRHRPPPQQRSAA
jgi:hypothetical protein